MMVIDFEVKNIRFQILTVEHVALDSELLKLLKHNELCVRTEWYYVGTYYSHTKL